MRFTVQFVVLVLAASHLAFAEWEAWYQEGRHLAVEGKLAEARSLLSAALRHAERRTPGSEYVAATLHELGLVSLDLGRNAEARRYLTRCLELRRELGHTADGDTAKTLNALAIAHMNEGKLHEADDLVRQALVIFEKQVGREHPDYGISLQNLAVIRAKQDRLAEAAEYFEQALSIFEQTSSTKTMRIVRTLVNLTVVASRLERFEQADFWSARALEMAEHQCAETPEVLAQVLFIRAKVLNNIGRKRERKAVERQAKELLKTYQESTGAKHTVDASELRQR